jgi:RNA polymerase sigma-70 factor, ECF subfamily
MVTLKDKYKELSDMLVAGLGGNAIAYANFLNKITPILRRVVARRIIHSDSDDVVQEILISIHKARHTYDGLRPIMPWIISIARFRVTDHLRKHYSTMRHQAVDIEDLKEILADVTEGDVSYESIDELLHDVSEQNKKILTMMHIEGFTAKEIGKQLNMNESAVKVAAHRAVKKIRESYAV